MSDPKALIFDMDGVLVDSFGPHFETYQVLAREIGGEFTMEAYAKWFGRTTDVILKSDDWPEDDLTDEQIRQRDDRKEILYREIVDREFPAMDGAVELMKAAKDAGFHIGIGTAGPRGNLDQSIEKLGVAQIVEISVASDDVTRTKPDPEVYLKVSDGLGVPPRRCVVIEDSIYGVAAAKAAGAMCVGFCSTGHSRDQYGEADIVVDSLRELSPARFDELLSAGA
ncbi:HAD family hydrolase [Stratiformator vulcanicus]|uniref:Phosphorylated carbohydrates phosphatase n=1 Tax=Stratiformator vulcanicus TaxID=2527980 RepID=A0A517QVM7_9PLAN|nr:HAD family phosphatase [Stratiformator vulcanicus]QDT35660.1 Phosphorylated carbohydrates phosphatase [Stratiformator vulcanicus]